MRKTRWVCHDGGRAERWLVPLPDVVVYLRLRPGLLLLLILLLLLNSFLKRERIRVVRREELKLLRHRGVGVQVDPSETKKFERGCTFKRLTTKCLSTQGST